MAHPSALPAAVPGPDTSVPFLHEMPGQYVYRGVVHLGAHPVEALDALPDFDFYPEDILVATYPKSGTTWMCEVADVVQHDGDTKMAARAPITTRWPYIEMATPRMNCMQVLKAAKPPRQIKTHMDASFFTKQVHEQGVKTLVVFRNPKDTLVSYFHFYRMNQRYGSFKGSWDDFFEVYRANQLNYGDPIEHMLSWWALRDLPNVKVFMYEDMLKDGQTTVKRVAELLGKQFTDAQIEDIVTYTSFDNMKKNPTANYSWVKGFSTDISEFMRKGEVGDWKNYFNEEQNRYVDERVKKRLSAAGITCTFE